MKKKLLFRQFFGIVILLITVLFAGDVRAGASSSPVKAATLVASGPIITIGHVSGYISACAGTASTSPYIEQFTVSGSSLTASINATAPTNFEVSLSASSGYGSSVSIAQSGGVVSSTLIYVRSASSVPAGSISGNVVLASAGATSQNVAVTGQVHALAAVNPVANQTVTAGRSATNINFTGTANTFTWANNNPAIGLAASGEGNIHSFTATNNGSTPITATITVTPVANEVAYITVGGSGSLEAFNTITNTLIATKHVGGSPLIITVTPDGSRAYIANSSSNTVLVINTSNYLVESIIPVGSSPYGICVSPDGSKVYVANNVSHTVSVINTATGTVASTIAVGKFPEGVAVSSDGSLLYVANSGSNTVSVFNTTTNALVSTIPTGSRPTLIAISPNGNWIYVTNVDSNNVSVINAATNAIVATVPVGTNPVGVAVSRDGNTVYTANLNSQNVSVINALTNTFVTNIAVGTAPVGVAITPEGDRVFALKINNNISVINPADNIVIRTDTLGSGGDTEGIFISGSICAAAPVTFTITVNPSNNANLSNLTISSGTLTPAFSSATTSYTDTVGSSATSVQLTPTTSFNAATVKVNGTTVTSGSPSASIPLTVAPTTIYTVITAADGTPRTYTVKVIRRSSNANLANLTVSTGTISPAFATGTTSYTESVPHATDFISLSPTTSDANATVKVNGTTVASGTASPGIYLQVGDNYIHAVVTAQDGTVKSYTVVVTRPSNGLSTNANLANLTISSGTLKPAFATAIVNYADTVSNATTSVAVTPTTSDVNATVKVNGISVTSGSPSGNISLAVGNNAIHTVVLAQDGTQRTYTITVHRLTTGGLNSFYLPGSTEQTPLISSLNEGVEASNILSPNGDGINDVWIVKNIAFYPDNTVTVYDHEGSVVFTKKGYANDWDGTYRSSILNEGTYYYKVDLGNGAAIKGFITVLRDR